MKKSDDKTGSTKDIWTCYKNSEVFKKFKFVIGKGFSKKGPIPPTEDTNIRASFKPNTSDFVKAWVMEGLTHHYTLGIGHHNMYYKERISFIEYCFALIVPF